MSCSQLTIFLNVSFWEWSILSSHCFHLAFLPQCVSFHLFYLNLSLLPYQLAGFLNNFTYLPFAKFGCCVWNIQMYPKTLAILGCMSPSSLFTSNLTWTYCALWFNHSCSNCFIFLLFFFFLVSFDSQLVNIHPLQINCFFSLYFSFQSSAWISIQFMLSLCCFSCSFSFASISSFSFSKSYLHRFSFSYANIWHCLSFSFYSIWHCFSFSSTSTWPWYPLAVPPHSD